MNTIVKYTFTALIGTALLASTLAVQAGDVVTYVHTDPLGNPVAKTDSTGEVIWRQSYTPYGQQYQQADPDGSGFTGHRNDAATGLVYMQARYYDPKIGRFLSVDPVGFSPKAPQFFDRYWYAQGNPYKYTDPTGMFDCSSHKACDAGNAIRKGFQTAQKGFKKGSKDFNVLQDKLTKLGTEGDHNGLMVNLTISANGPLMTNSSVNSNGTANFNIYMSGQDIQKGAINSGNANLVASGAHELNLIDDNRAAGHMPTNFTTAKLEETRATVSEIPVWKGLNQADPNYQIWTPSGGINSNEIDRESTVEANYDCDHGGCPQ